MKSHRRFGLVPRSSVSHGVLASRTPPSRGVALRRTVMAMVLTVLAAVAITGVTRASAAPVDTVLPIRSPASPPAPLGSAGLWSGSTSRPLPTPNGQESPNSVAPKASVRA